MTQLISHGECGKSWTGLRRAHCASCHETFNSDYAAEQHRTGSFGPGGDRHCLTPVEAGLVSTEQAWGLCWQTPSSDTRFTTADDTASELAA